MAGPKKKPHVETLNVSSSDSGEENTDNEDEELSDSNREIQVDFEGRTAEGSDFHGIKNLLQQLFLKAHIDLSKLVDLIIEQNFIGSVLKQCVDEDDDSGEEQDSIDEVFGITTIVDLSATQNDSVNQIRKHLQERTKGKLEKVFKGTNNHVGLLINERFINIPPQVSVPLLESLSKELEEANSKGKNYNFTHYVIISKIHTQIGGKGASKQSKNEFTLWVNAEEEPMCEIGEILGEYSVQGETDAAVSGTWDEDDQQFEPKRRILLIRSDQWREIMNAIKEFLS
nr:EOG090X0C3Y [Cyclestheria hislopi]